MDLNLGKMFSKLFLILALFASCSKTEPLSQKPTILVSIAPYKGLVQRVAGDAFDVEAIVPEGANPHAYEPTPRDVQAIARGVLWFQVGESFEKKILPVLQEKNSSLVSVDLRKSITLIQNSACKCDESGEDRHIWLSPKNLIFQVKTIQESLSALHPENKELFENNATLLVQELEHLDQKIQKTLAKAPHRSFVVAHPAFGYFCRDYDLKQLSIEFEGKEPTAKYLTQVIETATSLNTTLAVCMPEHPSKGAVVIADKLHLRISTIHPYSCNFLSEMDHLAMLVAEND